jgi:hypothetical protein
MSAENQGSEHGGPPDPGSVPVAEPPPYEPDLSLITDLEKGLWRDADKVQHR